MACHLTMEERDQIAQFRCQGVRQKEIAQALKRSRSTIGRELRRNATGGEYLAAQAQRRAATCRRDRPLVRKMEKAEIRRTVCNCLKQYWSPEQIAGRLRLEVNDKRRTASARTIYSWIATDRENARWRRVLRNRGKRGSRSPRPEAIGAPIADRPQVIEKRSRLGDFEGDTILGPGKGGLATLVDRKSRYTIVVKIESKYADHVQRKIKGRLSKVDEARRRSVTFDHGTEFARTGCAITQ